jgi:hypothetical protein
MSGCDNCFETENEFAMKLELENPLNGWRENDYKISDEL